MLKYVRRQKMRFLSFSKEHSGIFLFGLRRGGTTMVADAIMSNPGIFNVNEPFAVLPVHDAYELKKKLLPPAPHSHFFGLAGDDLSRFAQYVDMLEHGKLRNMGGVAHPLPPLKANRVSLKILNAPWMIDWFADETDGLILSMLRHPAAQALSVIRQKWDFPVTAYAARETDLHEFLNDTQISTVQDVCATGSQWQRAILDWCVTSHPLRSTQNARVIRFTYEDVVNAPEQFVDEVLVQKCGLPNRQIMLEALGRPSNSSKMNTDETTAAILAGQTHRLTESWRSKVDKDMARQAQDLLDTFDVHQYSMKEEGRS